MAALLGRLDSAFEIARALFLSEGYGVPDLPASSDGTFEVTIDSRNTRMLFRPTVQNMRADPRFETLMTDIGLSRYWRESGSKPDCKA